MLATANKGKIGRGFEKYAGEWTGRVEMSSLSPVSMGKGIWKFNATFLKNPDLGGKINRVLHCASQEIPTDGSILP